MRTAALLLCLLAACPPVPEAAPEAPAREVSVTATSRVNVAPDEAVLHLEFAATAGTMRASHTGSAKALAKFQEAAAALGLPQTALELAATFDRPNTRWDGSGRVVSYTSETDVDVKTPTFELVPDIVDAAVAAGASAISVEYHSTTLPEHKKRARDLAVVAAREKATQLAEGLGAKLGPVLRASEGTTDNWSWRHSGNVVQNEVSSSPGADVPLAPGTTPLDLTIEVTFALQ